MTPQARDPLTHLRGRAALLEACQLLTAPALLVVLDVDGLSTLNARQGLAAGDDLLQRVAHDLSAVVDPAEVHRTGDDEFGCLLPLPADPATAVAALMRQWHEAPDAISIRLGWACAEPADPSGAALARAAAAVQSARTSANGIAGFTDVDVAAAHRREAVGRALTAAMLPSQQQLHLVYQPIVRLLDQSLVAVETLIRWQHPTLGVIPPDEFVTLAEQTGQSCALDRWVLTHALAQMKEQPLAPVVHVNVSASSLTTPGFTDEVLDLVGAAGVEPTALCFELTETALSTNNLRLKHAVETLHADGIAISIDDFGTGHASWSYLNELPVHQLKVDRSFVQDVDTDPRQAAIARAIIEVARACGQEIVAEGVETVEQARTLLALGCALGQGYLLGRPESRGPTVITLPDSPTPTRRRARRLAPSQEQPPDVAQQLTDLTRSLSAAPSDPTSVLALALGLLGRSIDFQGGSLQLAGPDGMRLAAARPTPPPEALAARLPLGQGVAGTVLTTGRPVYLPDITSSPAVPTRRRAISGGVRSYLAVPLFQDGEAIGVLQIDSHHVDAFSDSDRVQLSAAAAVVAAALSRATPAPALPLPRVPSRADLPSP